jgi:hypothetical protein
MGFVSEHWFFSVDNDLPFFRGTPLKDEDDHNGTKSGNTLRQNFGIR